MPIKCIPRTSAAKLGPIAATYRAAVNNPYGVCPNDCPLKPTSTTGTVHIDQQYLARLRKAVPRAGLAWTYSHFPHTLLPLPKPKETVINASTDTLEAAIAAQKAGHPTVYAAQYKDTLYPRREQGIRFIRCPAETNTKVTCANCGGGTPLCARGDRDYVIVFVKHGSNKKKVAGSCYASTGNVAMHWQATAQSEGTIIAKDGAELMQWVKTLPPRTLLRHHIAGDLG